VKGLSRLACSSAYLKVNNCGKKGKQKQKITEAKALGAQ
jgi:hypothetical protein